MPEDNYHRKRLGKKKTSEKKIFLKRNIPKNIYFMPNPKIFIGRMEVLKLKFKNGK